MEREVVKLITKYFNELTTTELYEILKARSEIFLLEQRIVCQDMDNIDYKSLHCFLMQNQKVIAYLRAYKDDNEEKTVLIGRILTLTHGQGIGRALLEQSLAVIKDKMKCDSILLHAQKQAVGFYQKFGFQVISDDFLEEGVLHNMMVLDL